MLKLTTVGRTNTDSISFVKKRSLLLKLMVVIGMAVKIVKLTKAKNLQEDRNEPVGTIDGFF